MLEERMIFLHLLNIYLCFHIAIKLKVFKLEVAFKLTKKARENVTKALQPINFFSGNGKEKLSQSFDVKHPNIIGSLQFYV